MKRFLLLSVLFLAAINLHAQFTMTDDHGNSVLNGATLDVNYADANTPVEVHYHFVSARTENIRVRIESTTQVSGTINTFCVGQACYAPNTTESPNISVTENVENLLKLGYDPKEHSNAATIVYRIYSVNNPNTFITFTVEYTMASGIELLNASEKLKAFPNPANDKVEIAYKATEASQIVLYNIVGTKVKSFNVSAGTSSIEIATDALPAGTYFYSLINKQGTETKRLVIKH